MKECWDISAHNRSCMNIGIWIYLTLWVSHNRIYEYIRIYGHIRIYKHIRIYRHIHKHTVLEMRKILEASLKIPEHENSLTTKWSLIKIKPLTLNYKKYVFHSGFVVFVVIDDDIIVVVLKDEMSYI